METVNYKLIHSVNREIIEAQAKSEKLVDRLEKLSTNSNLKYLNFKVIGGALGIGLLLGAVAVGGYSYYRVHQAEDSAFKINKQLVVNLVNNFTKIKTKSEMLKYTYAPVGTNITNSIKINNFVFKRLDIVNGWVFQRAQPLFHKAFFTNAKNGNLVVVNLKNIS